MGGLAETVDAG